MQQKKPKIPVIMYEPEGPQGEVNPIPYIEVSKEENMPPVLFISEYKETGEYEPDEDGNEAQIVDMLIHKYVDMELLKERLPEDVNDQVRMALGMKPLKEAQKQGQPLIDKVMEKAEQRKDTLSKREDDYEERKNKFELHLKKQTQELFESSKDKKDKNEDSNKE